MSKTKLNILMISVRADHGGGPKHLYQLISHLNSQFNLFTACPIELPYWNQYKEILGLSKMIEIPHRKFSLLSLLSLKKFITANNIHIVHSHGKGAGIYGRLLSGIANVKCVHTFHGLHIGGYMPPLKIFYILLEKLLGLFTDKFIAVSQSEAERLLSILKLDKGKLNLIENGINIPEAPVSLTDDKQFQVLTITRFDFAKNTLLLIDILHQLNRLKSLHKFRFKIIGEGSDRNTFESLIMEHGYSDFVELLNFTENIAEHYQGTFCYISTSRWEGLPLTVLEAMSFGIPVIATNVVGNKDLIQQGRTGFMYELNSPMKAAEHLIELEANIDLRKNISSDCRKFIIDNYSLNKMISKTALLYNTLWK